MFVDGGIGGGGLNGLLQMHDGLVVFAEREQHPSEAVDNIAVVRTLRISEFDQAARFLEVHAAVEIGVSKIIEHAGFARFDLKGFLEILLGVRPVFRALVGNAAGVIDRPVFLGLRRAQLEGGGIFGHSLAETFFAA